MELSWKDRDKIQDVIQDLSDIFATKKIDIDKDLMTKEIGSKYEDVNHPVEPKPSLDNIIKDAENKCPHKEYDNKPLERGL